MMGDPAVATDQIPLLDWVPAPAPLPAPVSTAPSQLYADPDLKLDGDRTIRVLDIERTKGNEYEAPLRGRLRVVDLRQSPAFTALSYVWGAPDPPDRPDPLNRISCNHGREIPITSNCRDALKSLRHIYGGVTIWVDAICINQKDNEEKKTQLPLMGDIYTWAQTVFVWIGPSKIEGVVDHAPAINALLKAGQRRPAYPGIPWLSGPDRYSSTKDAINAAWELTRSDFMGMIKGHCKISLGICLLTQLN